jgi:hypothetical protein
VEKTSPETLLLLSPSFILIEKKKSGLIEPSADRKLEKNSIGHIPNRHLTIAMFRTNGKGQGFVPGVNFPNLEAMAFHGIAVKGERLDYGAIRRPEAEPRGSGGFRHDPKRRAGHGPDGW